MEEKMRVMSRTELARCTRSALQILLQVIAAELPRLSENSPELRAAHNQSAECSYRSRAA